MELPGDVRSVLRLFLREACGIDCDWILNRLQHQMAQERHHTVQLDLLGVPPKNPVGVLTGDAASIPKTDPLVEWGLREKIDALQNELHRAKLNENKEYLFLEKLKVKLRAKYGMDQRAVLEDFLLWFAKLKPTAEFMAGMDIEMMVGSYLGGWQAGPEGGMLPPEGQRTGEFDD